MRFSQCYWLHLEPQMTKWVLANVYKHSTAYKCYLLKQVDALDVDNQYVKLKMRKLKLEIQQLERYASRTVIIKTMTHGLLFLFDTT